MNPMDFQEQVLPEDLQEVERMLRAAPPPAPPALLERITASREIAVVVERMLLTDDPFAKRSQQYRTLISIAASALLMVGAFSVWRYVDSRTPSRANVSKTPRVAAANQVARLPKVAVAPDAPFDELTRILQPWPSSAQLTFTAPDDRIRAADAALDAFARARLQPNVAIYRRTTTDARGNVIGEAEVAVTLNRESIRGEAHWLLSTHPLSQNKHPVVASDSIILDDETLMPLQRRIHGDSLNRYFRFGPTEMLGTDTLAQYFFTEPVVGPNTRFEPVSGPLYWYTPRNPRHTLLLSEPHLALLLRTYPLWVGWSMTVNSFSSNQNRYTGKTLFRVLRVRVTAIDTLTIRTDRIPNYRVEVDYGARPDVLWINANTGELMRSERTTSAGREVTRLVSTR